MPHVELPQAEFKVVMLGDTFTGKTSLVLRFAEGYYRDSARSATVGAFFITKRLSVQGMTCKVQIWDTAGQEQFKKLAPMYYKNAAAAIVCYDITSPKSFDTLKYWIDELQRNVPAGKIVMAMCATKCDLSSLQPVDTSQAEALAQETGAMFLTTSAKQNDNVTLLFEQVAERVLQFQRQNAELNIPVRLATTNVETHKVPHHPHLSSSSTPSQYNNGNGHLPALSESHPSSAASDPRIGNNHNDNHNNNTTLTPGSSPPRGGYSQQQHGHQLQQQNHHQDQHYQNQQLQQQMFQQQSQDRELNNNNNKDPMSTNTLRHKQQQRADFDDNVALNPTDSTDADTTRCDANMLMCGGEDLLKASEVASSYSQSCCIL